jgi:hypothetical protein
MSKTGDRVSCKKGMLLKYPIGIMLNLLTFRNVTECLLNADKTSEIAEILGWVDVVTRTKGRWRYRMLEFMSNKGNR